MDFNEFDPNYQKHYFVQQNLPNSTAVLVLGIVSIFGCCCYIFPGLILSIIALILAKQDFELYKENPTRYTDSSFKNLKAGRVCAAVTLSIIVVLVLYIIFVILTLGFESFKNQNYFNRLYT